MVLLATIILALMALINYILGGKRLFYPPVVFCSVWAVDLAIIWLAGDFFYPLSNMALTIFCIGGLAFSVGSALALFLPIKAESQRITPGSNRLITFLVIALACSSPFVYTTLMNMAASYNAPNFLMGAYMAMVAANAEGERLVLLSGILTLSVVVAMIAFLEYQTGKKRALLAIVIAFAFNIMTGGRSSVTGLIFALVYIDWFKNNRVRWRQMALLLSILVLIFCVMAVFVGKGGASADVSLSDNVRPVLEGVVLYAVGGIVGFDRVLRQPNVIPHSWQIDRFFLDTANKFGAHFYIPVIHADFVSVGPALSGNVYTMYFAYIDLGYVGMMVLVVLIGFILGLVHRKAIQGKKVAIIMASFFTNSLILSPYNENYSLALNTLIKIFILSWLVYNLPSRWRQLSGFLARINLHLAPPERKLPPVRH
ncbi:MAG TPA: O-antigen polymerase [Candidatus Angelobacter sp.]|jgi:oligosaccharide repeat unit polymerase